MPVIYLITSIKDFISVKKQVQDGVEFVVLETGSDFTCLDLEDEETAGKVEYALIDLPVLAKHWKRMTALKWVHTFFNGADVLLKTVHKEALPTFTLTRTLGHVNAPLISDYVIGHIIAAERKFFLFKEFQNEAKWNSEFSLRRWRPLNTRTIGILGVGLIGSHVAETCKKLGMTVWGLTRTLPSPETSCSSIDVYKTQKDLSVFLSACDYLCAVLPSTPGTRNLLSGNVLQACQEKKPVLISVGRGDVVDEATIVKAITNGWLGGAVLDVLPVEPLPASSALWKLPGVIITPHSSGWSLHPEYLQGLASCFFDNVDRFLKGKPLLGVVDMEKGY